MPTFTVTPSEVREWRSFPPSAKTLADFTFPFIGKVIAPATLSGEVTWRNILSPLQVTVPHGC